ncbi:hypothetical protein GCM10027429_29290 [Marivirga atlantica]|jgi:hypothetical protein|uniref:Lipoprotein n=1 Tax=Marivirga atlantica TaxID=1548457 RepID=A0A937AHX4_9BACT|nr:hypothetical protein [Marivirga atlantica]MBL0766508.1 hypothetical protein [Marivirga atlantica]
MSKYNRNNFLALGLIIGSLFFMGCPTPPEFPNTPAISFRDVSFEKRPIEAQPNVTEDVITITLGFEDGDGDLGLASSDIEQPYNQFFVPIDIEGFPIFIGDSDTLPPFNPLDYLVFPEDDTVIVGNARLSGDTIYIERNPRFYNIFIDMYYKPTNDSEFIKFDWEGPPYYQSFNGRFPILNTEDYERPLNGELSYELKSSGFSSVFRDSEVKIETYILDRAGNKSNVIQSDPIKLEVPE